MTVESLITQHIDTWTSAVKTKSTTGRGSSKKLELYGVKKLRELILELAVRGKLVPQDPSDEPASVLLERIAAEKVQLVKDKKIKQSKKLELISVEDYLFEIPSNWSWERLGNIGETNIGLTYSPKEAGDEGIPVLRSANIQKGKIDLTDLVRVQKDVKDSVLVDPGDLLICARNGSKALVGKTAQIRILNEPMAFGAFMAIFRSCINDYVEVFLNSPVYRRNLEGVSTTTINQITQSNLRSTICPIPPKEEQHRIVAKVDELMALCDQLEQQTEASIDAHQLLVSTLLNTLTNSADADELMENWARISDHFDTLFTTEESIDQLKQTILQLAVMGKLVPQDLNDEPASVLLERIAEEKAQLIKEKKIKKQKALPPIADDEKPFDLPKGWEWARFGELGYDLGGGTPSKGNSEYWGGSIPWVSPKDMKRDYIDSAIDNVTEKAVLETTIKLIPEYSLLMVVRGMILAHSFPVALTQKPVVINQDMKAFVYNYIEPEFLLVVMKGIKNEMVDLVDRSSHGTCKLVSDKLWNVVLSIPPLGQQRLIVKKTNELLSICEHLKTCLKESQTTQLHLTDTIVEQAV
ncbi:restriction endonuclease subunit S [Photobacterium damselae subsp. damselae]|uniref:restriction endonuclease subunit S n=1 Tax=Photobacterium damselae TaxID=38293 RepID=UPI00311AF993